MIWYVLRFSIKLSRICTFNEFEFLNKFGWSVHLMYIIFHWMFTTWYILQFSIEFLWFYTFNEFEFFNKFWIFVHLMYTIFPWILRYVRLMYMIYTSIEFSQFCTFKKFKFLNKSIRFVHLTYIIFHLVFMILYFQQNQISQQSRLSVHMYTFTIWSVHLPLRDLYKSFIFLSWSLSIIHMVTYIYIYIYKHKNQ